MFIYQAGLTQTIRIDDCIFRVRKSLYQSNPNVYWTLGIFFKLLFADQWDYSVKFIENVALLVKNPTQTKDKDATAGEMTA